MFVYQFRNSLSKYIDIEAGIFQERFQLPNNEKCGVFAIWRKTVKKGVFSERFFRLIRLGF